MNAGTWLGQQTYMRMADVDPLDCFFTNFYTAIKPIGSRGPLEATQTLKEQCRNFCAYQLRRTDPCLVVVMGGFIPDEFKLVSHSAQFIEIDHPSYPVQCGPGTEKSDAVYNKNVKKLATKLEEVGYYSRQAKTLPARLR
jgi:hypothetical protein